MNLILTLTMNYKLNGWIKTYRSIFDWEHWDDAKMVKFWLYLVGFANHENTVWKNMIIPRGSLVRSLATLQRDCNMTQKEVRNRLRVLQMSGQIKIKRAGKKTLITIVKYDDYQDPTESKGTKRAQKGHEKGTKRATDKEYINTTIINSINNKEVKKQPSNEFAVACHSLFNEIFDLFDQRFRPQNEDQKNKWLAELDKLNRLDGFSWDEIYKTIKWARSNNFWSANFLSCTKIRKKGSNGATKFQNMNQQFKREQQNENKTDRTSIQKDPSGGKKRTIDDFRSTTTPPKRTIDDFKPKK